jgi:hypothetical protein
MAIVASDIVFRYSTTSGSAGDTTAGAMATSLGKYVSTTAFSTGTNVTFDNISGSENAASTVDYRCIFILNNHATLTASNLSFFVSSEVSGGASIAIATDNIAVSAKGSSSAQAAQIASETTAPSGVSAFSTPTTDGAGLTVASLAAGQVKAIWIKRTAANTAAINNDGYTLSIALDTPA